MTSRETREVGTGAALRLPAGLWRRLEALAAAGYPHEACGLLLGRAAEGGVAVARVTEARNLNRERPRDRYLLDPEDFLAADRAAREEGLEIVGIWHSHPDRPARPSATDLDAAWEGYSYVIVGATARGAGELRSWRLAGDRFIEETVRREDREA